MDIGTLSRICRCTGSGREDFLPTMRSCVPCPIVPGVPLTTVMSR